mmetsp:Transcript_45206/g.112294  ORF Transcript_45206/g.112294 Transcript_45206/m.112294 type:complete len:274 (-) Transcript_45206:574-1395(-)
MDGCSSASTAQLSPSLYVPGLPDLSYLSVHTPCMVSAPCCTSFHFMALRSAASLSNSSASFLSPPPPDGTLTFSPRCTTSPAASCFSPCAAAAAFALVAPLVAVEAATTRSPDEATVFLVPLGGLAGGADCERLFSCWLGGGAAGAAADLALVLRLDLMDVLALLADCWTAKAPSSSSYAALCLCCVCCSRWMSSSSSFSIIAICASFNRCRSSSRCSFSWKCLRANVRRCSSSRFRRSFISCSLCRILSLRATRNSSSCRRASASSFSVSFR